VALAAWKLARTLLLLLLLLLLSCRPQLLLHSSRQSPLCLELHLDLLLLL
jgi:hypothetical protein